MSAFTPLGTALWDWEPWIDSCLAQRNLWLGLYTSLPARKIGVPGLWYGSIATMADAARMAPDDAIGALDKLLERDLVEFDRKARVLRLTQLPDACDSPANGNVIRGWFRRFMSVPSCQVRDAHVATVAWMMTTWSREHGKPISTGHQEAWGETFGTVTIPPPRRRGVRRLADSDTSSTVQGSLFAPVSGSDSEPSEAVSESDSVDNSASLRQLNRSDTLEPFRNGSPNRLDHGSGSGSGSGSLSSPDGGGSGEGHEAGRRRHLMLVPAAPAAPFEPLALVQAMGVLAAGLDLVAAHARIASALPCCTISPPLDANVPAVVRAWLQDGGAASNGGTRWVWELAATGEGLGQLIALARAHKQHSEAAAAAWLAVRGEKIP